LDSEIGLIMGDFAFHEIVISRAVPLRARAWEWVVPDDPVLLWQ